MRSAWRRLMCVFMCFYIVFGYWANAATTNSRGKHSEESIPMIQSQQVRDDLSEQIQRNYFNQALAPRIVAALNSIDLSAIQTRQQLADTVSTALHVFDKHLSLVTRTTASGKVSSQSKEPWFTQLARKNTGVRKVEVLAGNVGYLDYWGFDKLNQTSKAKLSAAFSLLEDTDVLILDFRENGGGDSMMLSHFASYFVPSNTHLSTYQFLSGGTYKLYSQQAIGPTKLQTIPLYILVSQKTFSAGEALAYTFKHLNRATIVGEVTKGGANPVNTYALSHGFKAFIPNSSVVSPVTNTNWEAVGVIPHLKTRAEQALVVAYQQALTFQKQQTKNIFLRNEIVTAKSQE